MFQSKKRKVVLELKQGLLSLIPLNQNAVRVQFSQPGSAPMEELIYTEKLPVPEYEVTEDKQSLVFIFWMEFQWNSTKVRKS